MYTVWRSECHLPRVPPADLSGRGGKGSSTEDTSAGGEPSPSLLLTVPVSSLSRRQPHGYGWGWAARRGGVTWKREVVMEPSEDEVAGINQKEAKCGI